MARPAPGEKPTPTAPSRDEDVRVGPLRPMVRLLHELGCDPAAVLAAGGLPPTAFDDPEHRIPMSAAGDVIHRGAALSGREEFGLLIGERVTLEDLGLLGQLICRARQVGEALYDLNRFLHVQDRGSVTFVRHPDRGFVTLGYSIYDPEIPAAALIYDLVMAIGIGLLRALAGPEFRATEVWLPHAAPRRVAPYRRVLGAPVRFEAPRAEIHFAADWLQAPVLGADAMQHALVQRAIRQAEARVAGGLAGRARAAVRALLMTGDVSAARVAAALELHERTLRRRLQAEGTSVHGLVAQARFEIARQLLRETRLSLRDIAVALGYAEASAFVRAFRGWAGCAPGQWRAGEAGLSAPPAAP